MVLKGAGKSKLKKKSEFRRRETEVSMAVAGYSILDSGCCPNPEEEKTEW
jgi:hypothetical protein